MADGVENQTLTESAAGGSDGTDVVTPEQAPQNASEPDDAGTGADGTAAESEAVDAADAEAGASADAEESDDADDDGDDGDDGEENPLDVEGEVAADYLEELLDIADLDGDIDTYVENGRAHVSVLTESEALIGTDGEVLEALQELSRLAVLTETGNRSRLMLDIGGHRERRRKELTDLATDAVQEVKDGGEAVRLAPMNPFERKIVHDVVADAGLTSESEGEEPQRRVVVQPGA